MITNRNTPTTNSKTTVNAVFTSYLNSYIHMYIYLISVVIDQ